MKQHSTITPNNKGAARTDILSLASGLRCKPGDLAIVGGRHTFKENLGCIVEIIAAAYISDQFGFLWSVRSVGRPMKMQAGKGEDMKFDINGYEPDYVLTPINGIPVEDAEDASIDQENTIPEEVH